jgi:hypothetical protein
MKILKWLFSSSKGHNYSHVISPELSLSLEYDGVSYGCTICDMEFKTERGLNIHFGKKHPK